MGLLKLAEEFGLKDYEQIAEEATEFYPILMKSYVEKAIQNYC
jgi:regulator of sigma D